MSLVVRLEGPDDRATAVEVERLAFGSDEEPAIVEVVDVDMSAAPIRSVGGLRRIEVIATSSPEAPRRPARR